MCQVIEQLTVGTARLVAQRKLAAELRTALRVQHTVPVAQPLHRQQAGGTEQCDPPRPAPCRSLTTSLAREQLGQGQVL